MSQPSSSSRRRYVALPLALGSILLVAVTVRVMKNPRPETSPAVTSRLQPQTSSDQAAMPVPDQVALRPLAVSQATATHQWTKDDATDPEVIERIAHNPDEFVRMVEENDRIKRRQLVYRQETAAAIVQNARATGEPVRRLTLPGFNGQEIEVEVTGSDLAFSGLSGTFTGRLPGKLQSIVTLAFKNNREAFSISSPEDGLYLEAEPREPGEVIVKAIDPATYATGQCGSDAYHQEQANLKNSQGR
jgi:hypothetical protein